MSKAFSSRHGKAYLFRNVANVTLGEKEERMMITGMHIVADIFCVCCGSNVGWKYESAYEKSQKYKEGKFILERFQILGPNGSTYPRIQEAQIVGSDIAAEALAEDVMAPLIRDLSDESFIRMFWYFDGS
ncbi:hypothetical protein ACET3Z_013949 [Daucus carota]